MEKGGADNSYFTSSDAADLLVSTLQRFAQPKIILEPCCGDGSLVNACKRKGVDHIHTIEIDEVLCKKHNWSPGDFLNQEPFQVDAVVCNPPFSEHRATNGTAKRGKDMALSFLVHAQKFAPILAFIMHQNKGSVTFDTKLRKLCPNICLIHRECIPKKFSTFTLLHNGDKRKFVPTSIYIYSTRPMYGYPSVIRHLAIVESVSDFTIVSPSNDETNMLVKRWGSVGRTGRLVSTDKSVITEEVKKKRKGYTIISAANFHLVCKNVETVCKKLEMLIPTLAQHFEYARDCSNVNLRPEEFYSLYALVQ